MGDKKKSNKWIYRIVIGVLCIIICVCLYKIGSIAYGYYQGTKAYNKVQELAGVSEIEADKIDFDALLKENKDTKGWIFSKGTVINYPVVQAADNDFYLYRLFNKEWQVKGSLFIDYRVENPFEDFITAIYGHRMKDQSMFWCLGDYRDEEYYNKHKKMEIMTPDKAYDVEIFSVVTVPADSDLYKFSFYDDQEKQEYINTVKSLNETKMDDVEVTPSDNIVLLSTCTYEFEDARLLVFGKLVEKKER